jgi:hypothetical protein
VVETTAQELSDFTFVGNYGLIWGPTGTSRSEFELRNGQQYLLARFWKMGLKAPSAVGETNACRIKIRRSGFMGRKVLIEPQSGEIGPAKFTYSGFFGKGLLSLSGGRQLKWDRGSVSGDRWAFVGLNGGMLVEFAQLNKSNWTDATGLNISDIGMNLKELHFLVLLGWYLIILMAPNEHTLIETEPFYSDRYES